MTRATIRSLLPAVAGLVVLAGAPEHAGAREPLPTIEVVQKPRRVRLLDTRGPLQFGWGYSNIWKMPVYQIAFEAQGSFVEITKTTWLHFVFGENVVLGAYPLRGGGKRPGMLGVDAGIGISRYASGGPAFIASVTGGPRWTMGRDRLAPDGAGIVGRADVYPFYRSIPELVEMERQWFRKYILSGLHVWVSARYDYAPAAQGNTYAGGVGLDVGRTLLLPIIERAVK